MAGEPVGGTPAANPEVIPQGGGTPATPPDGIQSGGETPEQKIERLEKLNKAKDAEILSQKSHIEEANRIRALAQEAVDKAARTPPPTGGADNGDYVSQITTRDVDVYRQWAQSDDPQVAAYGKGMLASLQLSNTARSGASAAFELLDIPDSDRPEVKRLLKEGKAGNVAEAARQVELGRLRVQADEGKKAIAKLAELNQPKEPVPGTHVRSTPAGPDTPEPAELKMSELARLYGGGPKDVAKARAFERREAQGKARLLPD